MVVSPCLPYFSLGTQVFSQQSKDMHIRLNADSDGCFLPTLTCFSLKPLIMSCCGRYSIGWQSGNVNNPNRANCVMLQTLTSDSTM